MPPCESRDRYVSIDYLGEDVTDADDADGAVQTYLDLIEQLGRSGDPADGGVRPLEVSLKLSALGQSLERDGEKIARENAWSICSAAQRVGVWVTVDAENHTTTDSTLTIVRDLLAEFPWLGTVLQAYLRRTLGDCEEFAASGARIRLMQGRLRRAGVGGLPGPRRGHRLVSGLPSGADGRAADIRWWPRTTRRSSPRCPPSLANQAVTLAISNTRCCMASAMANSDGWPTPATSVRVYVPFGTQWYGYFMRRLAERPANLAFFLRALAERRH